MQIRRSLAAGALSAIALAGFAAAPANADTTTGSDVAVDAATCTATSDAVAPFKKAFLDAQKAFNAGKAAAAKQANTDTKSARKAAKAAETKTTGKAAKGTHGKAAAAKAAKGTHGKAAAAKAAKGTHSKSAAAKARLQELKALATQAKADWTKAKADWNKVKRACGALDGTGTGGEQPTAPAEPTEPAGA